jgi:hypothetical protein
LEADDIAIKLHNAGERGFAVDILDDGQVSDWNTFGADFDNIPYNADNAGVTV